MVENESDIFEAFVRHNLALQSEGLPIVISDDPIFGYFQAD